MPAFLSFSLTLRKNNYIYTYVCMFICCQDYKRQKCNIFDNKDTKGVGGTKMYWNKEMTSESNLSLAELIEKIRNGRKKG